MADKKHEDEINKNSLEIQKLKSEIKSLKLQRTIAIIGVIITVSTTFLGNLTQIKSLFIPLPKVRVITNDVFVKRIGEIQIVNLTTKTPQTVLSTAIEEALEWISLEPGSYEIVLTINDKKVYSQKVLLQAGDVEPIIIPKRDTGNMTVEVVNHTPQPVPGAALDLSIDVSGNGYLWVFDYKSDGTYQIIYPNPTAKVFDNEVFVHKTFEFPDKNDVRIFTGETPGEERLLFVVTSSKNVSFAQEKALQMSKVILAKADAGRNKENWGVAEITYTIGK